jgi:5-methyltetrahydrofolate--homocysteine methyltransferase
MLEGAGFQVIDLGVDTTPEKYLEAVRSGVQIIGMSSLLTTTMPQMKVIIDELSKNGLRKKVKIMIGGAPVTQNFADQIKADGYSPDANGAVALARNLIKDKES